MKLRHVVYSHRHNVDPVIDINEDTSHMPHIEELFRDKHVNSITIRYNDESTSHFFRNLREEI